MGKKKADQKIGKAALTFTVAECGEYHSLDIIYDWQGLRASQPAPTGSVISTLVSHTLYDSVNPSHADTVNGHAINSRRHTAFVGINILICILKRALTVLTMQCLSVF